MKHFTQNRKTLLTLAAVLLAVVIAAVIVLRPERGSESGRPREATWIEKLVKSFSMFSTTALTREAERAATESFRAASREDRLRAVKYAPLQIEVKTSEMDSYQAILQLKLGLEDFDTEVKETAAASTESLLIDVAHGLVVFPGSVRDELIDLFSIYKRAATGRIAKTRAANPRSPTLTYLERI